MQLTWPESDKFSQQVVNFHIMNSMVVIQNENEFFRKLFELIGQSCE